MSRSIVVVGSANVDLVCTASRIPAPGETVWGNRFERFHGGKGANQAVAAGRLGGDVAMVAKVGDDDFGTMLRDGLRQASVNVDEVTTAAGISSGVALIAVDDRAQNSIIVIPGANGELRVSDLERCLPRLQSAGIILVQLETPLETVEALCHFADRAKVPLMLDPAPARELSAEVLRCVTYLTPNETETATLIGSGSVEMTPAVARDAAEKLLGLGARNVILKMGANGVFIAGADGLRKNVAALKVKAVDTTAAGDAFNGGLASALMRGLALEDAVAYAVAVAAVSVTRAGAQTAMPQAQEVADLLQEQGAAIEMSA